MSIKPMMSRALFYRGLLYALRELRPRFIADGDGFHQAFRQMLETAARRSDLAVPAEELLEEFDPVFGVSPHATEMVFDGERDFLLSLMNPRLVTAIFKITKEDAQAALDKLEAAETFRALARDFDSALPAAE